MFPMGRGNSNQGWLRDVALTRDRGLACDLLSGRTDVQDKKKFTLGMAIGVAAGMVLYRVLFG